MRDAASLLSVEHLVVRFRGERGTVHAVNDVSFSIQAGEMLGLVGESGSGKSTIGRAVTRLLEPQAGHIRLAGEDVTHEPERRFRPRRRDVQIIFQDPWSALNPRLTIRSLIEEPIKLHLGLSAGERKARAEAIAERVRLGRELLDRYPGQLSGGQLQRVCIARAIVTGPRLIVLDEPTSSLDPSVRAGILDLLDELRRETSTAMLFISHDLATVRLVTQRLMVLYLGAVVEEGPTEAVFQRPSHPYTQALLSAHLPADPSVPPRRHVLTGEIPSPIDLPPGCLFAGRCPVAMAACKTARPPLVPIGAEARRAACIRITDGGNRLAV